MLALICDSSKLIFFISSVFNFAKGIETDSSTFDRLQDGENITCAKEIFNSNNKKECTLLVLLPKDDCKYSSPNVRGNWSPISRKMDVQLHFFRRRLHTNDEEVVGLNLTVNILSNYTSGYLFQLNIEEEFTFCQVMDIHQLPRPITDKKIIWHKRFLLEDTTNSFILNVTEYPTGQSQAIRGKKPPLTQLDIEKLACWQASIFEDISNAKETSASILFNPAPANFSVDFYLVKLIDKTYEKEKEKKLVNGRITTTIRLAFNFLRPETDYEVTVTAVSDSCNQTMQTASLTLRTNAKERNFTWTILLPSVLIIFLLCACILYTFLKSCQLISNIPIVLLYLYDNPLHGNAVSSFYKLLLRGTFNVIMNRSPQFHEVNCQSRLSEDIANEANTIVIIWSDGAIKSQRCPNVKVVSPGNVTGEFDVQLADVIRSRFGCSQLHRSYRPVLHIVWDENNRNQIPKDFYNVANTFYLPSEWQSFLCRLHGHRTRFSFCRCVCYEKRLLNNGLDLTHTQEYSHFLDAITNYFQERHNINEEQLELSVVVSVDEENNGVGHDHNKLPKSVSEKDETLESEIVETENSAICGTSIVIENQLFDEHILTDPDATKRTTLDEIEQLLDE